MMKLKVPKYYQGKNDNACGPTCIRMVLDYKLRKSGKKLSQKDYDQILQETMKGHRGRESGTLKKDLTMVLQRRGIICRALRGASKEKRLDGLRAAISLGKPVILGCMANFKYYGRKSH
jgi:hypothetical protein